MPTPDHLPALVDTETGEVPNMEAAIAITEKIGAVARNPQDVIDEATNASKLLMQKISSKLKPVIVNGEQYLEFGDWQTVGAFWACSCFVEWTKLIEVGSVMGYEARCNILTRSGVTIASSEAMCLNDEPRWKNKPLYQLRSMAQTRAGSKALRMAFGWVAEMAGYRSTPAEEMNGIAEDKRRESKVVVHRDNGTRLEYDHAEDTAHKPNVEKLIFKVHSFRTLSELDAALSKWTDTDKSEYSKEEIERIDFTFQSRKAILRLPTSKIQSAYEICVEALHRAKSKEDLDNTIARLPKSAAYKSLSPEQVDELNIIGSLKILELSNAS